MKISLNTIKQYTEVKTNIEELTELIKTRIGEVETVEDLNKKYKGILVAEIKEVAEHPESDKLNVYQVDIGQKELVQVVAGGRTLEVGDKVAYIPPGTRVPFNAYPEKFDGIVQEVKLRGIQSNGMITSAREIDFSNNHEEVLRLDTDAKAGTTLTEAFGLNDYIFDVENKALTNRPDCFGTIGLAREIAGIQSVRYTTPDWYTDVSLLRPNILEKETHPLSVENKAKALCPRYMAVTLTDIDIKPSPSWLQMELIKAGVKPISNVVDITNYIMITAAQPMHAFDYDKVLEKDPNAVDQAHIVIRMGRDDESIAALDGKTHDLDEQTVLICDSTNPIAVGGIIGGVDTEVSKETTTVVLESANFDMYNIRKSSMRLGIATDAVTRYARGQDPNQCEIAMHKAIQMLQELAGAKLASNIVDNYEIRVDPWDVEVSIDRLNMHLGTQLTKKDITSVLTNIELEIVEDSTDSDQIIVKIPTYRRDLRIREDVHEDIARLMGYESIKLSLPPSTIQPAEVNKMVELKKTLRQELVAAGANEILTYNFVSSQTYENLGLDVTLAHRLRNSLSPELEYMRTTLLPSILEKGKLNTQSGVGEFALFELNITHNIKDEDEEKLPKEYNNLGLVYTAREKDSSYGSSYYQTKMYTDQVLQGLGISMDRVGYIHIQSLDNELPLWIGHTVSLYDSNAVAAVTVQVEDEIRVVGLVGEASPRVKEEYKLAEYSALAELNIDQLLYLQNKESQYREPSKYPKVVNDLSFIVKPDISYKQVLEIMVKSLEEDSDLVTSITPVDIYQPENRSDEKHITYRVTLQSRSTTLDGDDAKEKLDYLVKLVGDKTGGTLKE